jgi:hypothetical protein
MIIGKEEEGRVGRNQVVVAMTLQGIIVCSPTIALLPCTPVSRNLLARLWIDRHLLPRSPPPPLPHVGFSFSFSFFYHFLFLSSFAAVASNKSFFGDVVVVAVLWNRLGGREDGSGEMFIKSILPWELFVMVDYKPIALLSSWNGSQLCPCCCLLLSSHLISSLFFLVLLSCFLTGGLVWHVSGDGGGQHKQQEQASK